MRARKYIYNNNNNKKNVCEPKTEIHPELFFLVNFVKNYKKEKASGRYLICCLFAFWVYTTIFVYVFLSNSVEISFLFF